MARLFAETRFCPAFGMSGTGGEDAPETIDQLNENIEETVMLTGRMVGLLPGIFLKLFAAVLELGFKPREDGAMHLTDATFR